MASAQAKTTRQVIPRLTSSAPKPCYPDGQAERGTLTSAATALGYTQSAVSRQVASLERAAGTPLLERRHDGVRPTAAGHGRADPGRARRAAATDAPAPR